MYGEEEVAILKVDVAVPPLAGEADMGEKLQLELAGCPEQERVTAELNPLRPPSVTVNIALWPALTVIIAGDALMLKSGVGVVSGVIAANRPCISLARPAVMYKVFGSPDNTPPSKTISQSEAFVMGVPW